MTYLFIKFSCIVLSLHTSVLKVALYCSQSEAVKGQVCQHVLFLQTVVVDWAVLRSVPAVPSFLLGVAWKTYFTWLSLSS